LGYTVAEERKDFQVGLVITELQGTLGWKELRGRTVPMAFTAVQALWEGPALQAPTVSLATGERKARLAIVARQDLRVPRERQAHRGKQE